MYEDVKQLMPSGAKGKNVYQGSLATQQSPSRDAGRRGESSGLSQLDAAGSVSMTRIRSGMPPTDDEYEDIYGDAQATLPPPTPSPSKRRFSALESVDSSQTPQSVSAVTAPGGNTPTSRSTTSAKRGRMTSAIAVSSLGHELSDIKDILHQDIEMTKGSINVREERKRQEKQDRLDQERINRERRELERQQRERERLERERLERERLERERLERERLERERLERERLERERLEQERLERERVGREMKMPNPKVDAILRMQELHSDLSPDDQVTLVDLFNNEPGRAETYLALLTDDVRNTWISRRLAEAASA